MKYSVVTWTYNFSKHGKHLIKSIMVSRHRRCILTARILIVLTTVADLVTPDPFVKYET